MAVNDVDTTHPVKAVQISIKIRCGENERNVLVIGLNEFSSSVRQRFQPPVIF
jgi:hypothetical protein